MQFDLVVKFFFEQDNCAQTLENYREVIKNKEKAFSWPQEELLFILILF